MAARDLIGAEALWLSSGLVRWSASGRPPDAVWSSATFRVGPGIVAGLRLDLMFTTLKTMKICPKGGLGYYGLNRGGNPPSDAKFSPESAHGRVLIMDGSSSYDRFWRQLQVIPSFCRA